MLVMLLQEAAPGIKEGPGLHRKQQAPHGDSHVQLHTLLTLFSGE